MSSIGPNIKCITVLKAVYYFRYAKSSLEYYITHCIAKYIPVD